jgi:type IV pilus assembly protein PilV
MKPADFGHREQRGAALIEALVAMLIVAFGVLGYVGLQARTTVANVESYQRGQALVLVNDLVQRINSNRADAASYITDSSLNVAITYATETYYVGASNPGTCAGTRAQIDMCEWTKLLRGSAEGNTQGVVKSARGCVQQVGSDYLVTVFWEGFQGSGRSQVRCGNWNGASGTSGPSIDDTVLRGVSVLVRLGTLT